MNTTDTYATTFPAASTSENWTDRVVTAGHVAYCELMNPRISTAAGVIAMTLKSFRASGTM